MERMAVVLTVFFIIIDQIGAVQTALFIHALLLLGDEPAAALCKLPDFRLDQENRPRTLSHPLDLIPELSTFLRPVLDLRHTVLPGKRDLLPVSVYHRALPTGVRRSFPFFSSGIRPKPNHLLIEQKKMLCLDPEKTGIVQHFFSEILPVLKPEQLPFHLDTFSRPDMQIFRMKKEGAPVIAFLCQISLYAVALQTSFRKHQAQIDPASAHPQRADIAAASAAPQMRIAALRHADRRIGVKIRKLHIDSQLRSHRTDVKSRFVPESIAFRQRSPFRKASLHLYGQFRFALNRSPGLLSLHPVHAFLILTVLKRNQMPLLVPLCKKQRIFSCHFVICDLSHWFLSPSYPFSSESSPAFADTASSTASPYPSSGRIFLG